jgi:hypothetical protein
LLLSNPDVPSWAEVGIHKQNPAIEKNNFRIDDFITYFIFELSGVIRKTLR